MGALIAIHPISIQEVVSLLGYWRPHSEFQTWLEQKLLSLLPVFESQILFYEDILEKSISLTWISFSLWSWTAILTQEDQPSANRKYSAL